MHFDDVKNLKILMKGSRQIDEPSNTSPLEDYWNKYKLDENYRPLSLGDSRSDLHVGKKASEMNGYQKSRTMSTSSILLPGSQPTLTPHQPAATLLELLQTFGPLIFPLYRATLLRQRILLVSEAPVEFPCNIGQLSMACLTCTN